MAVTAPIAIAGAGVVAGLYESHEAAQAAERAARPKPQVSAPKAPTGLADTATEVQKANLLAQTAGGSLLSDPVENARSGKQIGTLPSTGKSLLGS